MSFPDLVSAARSNPSLSPFELPLCHFVSYLPSSVLVGHDCLSLGFPSFLMLSPFSSHGEKGVCKSFCSVFRDPYAAPHALV